MNHGREKLMLALLVGLAATVATLFLLSAPNTQAATLTVNSIAYSGPDALLSAAPRPSAGNSSLCATTDFTYPLTITLDIRDTFGPRLLKPGTYSRYDFHRGIDWPAAQGIPVHAVTTGTVRSFRGDWGSGTGSGNFVHLVHEGIGCETRYNHLSAVHSAITDGLQVTPGQIIGGVGDTGASYPHLHFEVRQGLTVTQRAAIHPLSTPFLPWTNIVSPAVALRGVYVDATGLTALVEVTSPYTEPDVTTVGVTVSGAVGDSRTIDYVELNANTTVVADLDDPLVNDVCIIPADLTVANGYSVTMAFRRLNHGPTATVEAQATDVDGWGSIDTAELIGGLEVTSPEQVAEGGPGQTVTFVYTLTNHGASDTFTLTYLSAQGWPAVVTPATCMLGNGESIAVTVEVTLNTDRFGPPDCGLLVAEAYSDTQRVAAGFYRIYRDAYVSVTTGDDHPGCGTQSDPCASISYGIGQTDAGGTIHVAEGTYTENPTLTKTIDLLASYPVMDGNTVDWTTQVLAVYSTTVDGGGNGAVLTVDGDYGPLIEGFTFVNGHRDGGGGGVRLVGGAAPTLRSNWILNNTANLSGGGIYVGPYGTLPPTIINNTIAGNTSKSSSGGGGGIYVKDRPALIQSNIISGNQATAKDGGGIFLTGDTKAQVLGNRILNNTATDDGGGVLVRSSGVYLANNLIRYNTAGDDGNGIRVAGYSTPCICNNTLVANHPESGAGLYIGQGSTPTVTNNIIANHAVGVHCSSPVTVSFSVLYNITDLDGSCVDSDNIYADPRLCDEVHLCPDSPAIDAGEMTSCVPSIDLNGIPRPRDGNCDGFTVVDIGAAEYYGCIYLPIALKNFLATGFEYDIQGCLGSTSTTDDLVEISVEGNDIVVHHYNVIYNCCAVIVVDFDDERPVLKLIERETYPGGVACPCTCPYDISARIPNLPSGNYRVEVWNWDQSHRYGWAEVAVP